MRCWFLTLMILTVACQHHMSTPVSNENGEDQEASKAVKELESLRSENTRANNTEHNHAVDSPTEKATPEPSANEESVPSSRSAIFRHRGITQAKKSKYLNEKPNEGYTKYAGIQYSPTDLAEYVFSTGDEEGVAVAVEELVREGMMGRTDAINYLQDVKQMLAYMRDQYEQQKKMQEFKNQAYPKPQISQRLPSLPREQFVSKMNAEKREPKEPEVASAPAVTTEHPHQEVIVSTPEPKGLTHSADTTARPKTDSSVAEPIEEDEYKLLIKETNIDDDFSWQVIYQLAKDMFIESIIKDNPIAEDTLTRLVVFLESEVGNQRISQEMKQKVLEIISKAMVDSLREYKRMMPENDPQNFEERTFYHRPNNQNDPSSSNMEIPQPYRKITI